MSPNSVRVLAGAAAAVLALLTAIAVGFVARPSECVVTTVPSPVGSATATSTATVAPSTPAGRLGDSVDNPPRQTVPSSQPAAPPPPGPNHQAAPPAPERTCDDGPFAAGPALAALVGTGLTALVLLGLVLLAGLRRADTPARAAAPGGGPSRPPAGAVPGGVAGGGNVAGGGQRLEADRTALVRACIYVRDRVTSRALSDRLAAALHDAGVVPVEPVRERFDPGRHEAGGATPTPDPALVGTIAAVEVPGYVDRGGRVLRAPVVTVYQAGQPSSHPTSLPQAHRAVEEDR